MPGAGVLGGQPVYAVVMVGHFTRNLFPSSGGTGATPQAPVVVSVLDARSHRELDVGFSERLPNLSRVGTVHNLRPYLLTAPLVPFLLGVDALGIGRVLADAGYAPLQIDGVPRSAYGHYVVTKQIPAPAGRIGPNGTLQLTFSCRRASGISPMCSG